MTFPQTINASASPEVQMNENFTSIAWAGVYTNDPTENDGLDRGYNAGRWGGFTYAGEVHTFGNGTTTYVSAVRSTGALNFSTSSTNYNDGTNYAKVETVVTSGGVVTTVTSDRAGPGGVHGGAASVAGGTTGRHSIPIMAGAMSPSATGGCAALATIASGANLPDIQTLDFDTTTQEYAQFSIPMPKSWNEGTVTFKPLWSHPATTTNFGVVWNLQAIALSNDDAIATAFGTAQTSTDTGGTTDDIYAGPESSAITIAGTPAAEDVVFFRLSRVTGDGGDTMAVDARLHGIVLYITTDAETDA